MPDAVGIIVGKKSHSFCPQNIHYLEISDLSQPFKLASLVIHHHDWQAKNETLRGNICSDHFSGPLLGLLVPRISNPWLHTPGFQENLFVALWVAAFWISAFHWALLSPCLGKLPKYFPVLALGFQGIPRRGAWDSDTREDGGEMQSCARIKQVLHCSWRTLGTFIAGDVTNTAERDLQQLPALWLHIRISALRVFFHPTNICDATPHVPPTLPHLSLLLQCATQALTRNRRWQACPCSSEPWVQILTSYAPVV